MSTLLFPSVWPSTAIRTRGVIGRSTAIPTCSPTASSRLMDGRGAISTRTCSCSWSSMWTISRWQAQRLPW
eukprot:5560374-Alexandrium_andersonii.AAC.1